MLRKFMMWMIAGLAFTSSSWADDPVLPLPPIVPPPVGPIMAPGPVAPGVPNLGWASFPGNALIPGSPYAPAPGGYVPPPPVPAPGMRCCLNPFGVGCWAHHDQFGCSSLHSTLVFQFGSCRAFFGETCRQEPPPLPIPNGLGLRSVYPPR